MRQSLSLLAQAAQNSLSSLGCPQTNDNLPASVSQMLGWWVPAAMPCWCPRFFKCGDGAKQLRGLNTTEWIALIFDLILRIRCWASLETGSSLGTILTVGRNSSEPIQTLGTSHTGLEEGSTCLALCANAWGFVTQSPTGFQSDRNGLEPIFTGDPWHHICGGPCFPSGSLPGWHPDCWAVPRSYKSLEFGEGAL